jgi:ankyrin repeat protein
MEIGVVLTREWEESARRGDAAALAAQLEAGSDVDSLDRHGQSALMIAARHGHPQAIRVLIRAGADLDITAKYGLSATMLAVVNHHTDVARTLAKAGADLSLVGTGAPGFSGKTAAQIALDVGEIELARVLASKSPSA